MRAKLAPKVQELREADEWQRWANLQVQEELCRQMEALKDEQDAEAAARRMRGCRTAGRKWRWRRPPRAKPCGAGSRRRRTRSARTGAGRTSGGARCQPGQKRALCECCRACRVHRLASTAVALQALQARKTIGPVTRGHEKAVWESFARVRSLLRAGRRTSSTGRSPAANLAREKGALRKGRSPRGLDGLGQRSGADSAATGRVEDGGSGSEGEIGGRWQRPVPRDRFFERFKHRDQAELASKAEPRETVIRELEQLLSQDGSADATPPDGLVTVIQQARAMAAGARAAAANAAGLGCASTRRSAV